jgi:hypothetical protein
VTEQVRELPDRPMGFRERKVHCRDDFLPVLEGKNLPTIDIQEFSSFQNRRWEYEEDRKRMELEEKYAISRR